MRNKCQFKKFLIIFSSWEWPWNSKGIITISGIHHRWIKLKHAFYVVVKVEIQIFLIYRGSTGGELRLNVRRTDFFAQIYSTDQALQDMIEIAGLKSIFRIFFRGYIFREQFLARQNCSRKVSRFEKFPDLDKIHN